MVSKTVASCSSARLGDQETRPAGAGADGRLMGAMLGDALARQHPCHKQTDAARRSLLRQAQTAGSSV